ncbi:hypothetical protein PSEUBRA_003989 [Kalmanozyma brasiliensis GHG001]|uniref:Uncharacterized protein n=1 Tax=Kalmanozyma brasiliensis (strain GHG001) TaxID=1365824 RepID=V5GJJ1_KALBG|nr:uncharacterized protein PSEUBRA_003989 [Kalmanozyma brasiliensis GHG001]EST06122.1 hypothetical protein PSEUBRA_003989 [Kalmanozyma brasiliensis GHG001]
MKAILAILLLTLTSVLAVTPSHSNDTPPPAPGTQPGCGPAGCHNPTGLFGLIRNPRKYDHLCDFHHIMFSHDHRPRACFDTQLPLEKYLSAPNPQTLHGFVDKTDTKFVLFAGQIVTLDERYEMHVDEVKDTKWKWGGCSRVRIYLQPRWVLERDEIWCPGHDEPIEL